MRLTRTIVFRGPTNAATGSGTSHRYMLVASPRPELSQVQVLISPLNDESPMPAASTFTIEHANVDVAFTHVIDVLRRLPQNAGLALDSGA